MRAVKRGLLQRLDELSTGAAVGVGSVVGLMLVLLLPGTVWGACVAFGVMVGLFWLGLSGRVMLVTTPKMGPKEQAKKAQASEAKPEPPVVPVPPPPRVERWLVAEGVEVELVRVDGGEFWMGSPDEDKQAYEDEKPRHRVKVSSFWMMKVGVTERLYQAVMSEGVEGVEGVEEGELPKTWLNWIEAVRFCNALSERMGLRACYQETSEGWSWDRTADGFRLPTEAEREYATRAGSEGAYCFGDDEAQLGEYAWFEGNSENKVHPVGPKKANKLGLYDVHGNVWEWCWDWYGRYEGKEVTDPTGPPTGNGRVLRGGSFWLGPWDLRSANRRRLVPEGQPLSATLSYRSARKR